MEIIIRPINPADSDWIGISTRRAWGSEMVVVKGALYNVSKMPGFIAIVKDKPVGLITYFDEPDACMIVTLNSWLEGVGIGRKLIKITATRCQQVNLGRLWLITTNDNLKALHFYQKLGFQLKSIYPDSISEARKLKPGIPLIGQDGIPIRDEIELELMLKG